MNEEIDAKRTLEHAEKPQINESILFVCFVAFCSCECMIGSSPY